MTIPAPPSSSGYPRRTAWLAGAMLGAIGGILLFVFPAAGVLMLAVALGLVLWQGPRLAGLAGIVSGIGLTWTVVFLRVKVECEAFNAAPGQECVAPEVDQFLAGAAAVAVVGALLSVAAWAARRHG
jgi:hypothetical protein